MRPWKAALAAIFAAGCAAAPVAPNLGELYNREATHHDPWRNPVVVIPGILGSKLRDAETGRVVWGAFAGDYADPETPEGARLVALPMEEGEPLSALRDAVRPDGVLDTLRVELLSLPIELGAYVGILRTLGVGGYRDRDIHDLSSVDYGEEHFTCFQFSYDWRRSNADNAARLHAFLLETKEYVRGEMRRRFGVDRPDLKFDLIAHSMGGLLTRYYLMHGAAPLPEDGPPPPVDWAGAGLVERAVLIGAPNAGSAKAVMELVHGSKLGPTLPEYAPAVLGTMPAVYELMPRSRHNAVLEGGKPVGDLYDPALWERRGWGLAAPDRDDALRELLPGVSGAAARRRIALDHLRKSLASARRFQEAIDRPAAPPPGLSLYLIAGDAVPTLATVGVDPAGGAPYALAEAPGDGTVTRASALMDERAGGDWSPWLRTPVPWRQVTFLFSDHLGLTSDPAFTDNVLFLLLQDPRRERPAP